jgi:intracellular sulfur oxidation DsrE/DsrF family protein
MKRGIFLGTALAGAVPAYVAAADGIPGGVAFVEAQSSFDRHTFETAVGKPAQIRQMWENVALKPGVLGNIKNSLNGLQFGYGYAPETIATAAVNHGPSAAYAYGDETWRQYRIAEFVNYMPSQQAAVTRNPFYARTSSADGSRDPNDERSIYQDTSIEALQARGVVFLVCHTAVMEQSRALVKAGNAPSGMNASDVAADILTHLIPGAIVVPSGVATVAVLQQRFRYTYITIQ